MAQSLVRVLDDVTPESIDKLERGLGLIAFGTKDCVPFQQLKPTLEALAKKYAGRVVIYTYDVNAFQDRTLHFDVKGIPTLLLVQERWCRVRMTGCQPLHTLVELLDSFLEGKDRLAAWPGENQTAPTEEQVVLAGFDEDDEDEDEEGFD